MKHVSMLNVNEVSTPAYIVDIPKFRRNILSQLEAFRRLYPNYQIGYSYKTNYVKDYCINADSLGCFAEIVSKSEYHYAVDTLRISPSRVIYNGVIDDFDNKMNIAKNGGIVNVDNVNEFKKFVECSSPNRVIELGVRLNFSIGNGVSSRFGIDTESDDFKWLADTQNHPYVKIKSVHFHIGEGRTLDMFYKRIVKMVQFAKLFDADIVDIGGNMCGPMYDSYKKQFAIQIPTISEYADVICSEMRAAFPNCSKTLITENGTSLVADTMHMLASIIGIKKVGCTHFVIVDTKMHDVGSSCVSKSPAYEHFGDGTNVVEHGIIAGCTCLDIDRIVKDYSGYANIGDKILIKGIGAYSYNCRNDFITPKANRVIRIEEIDFGRNVV